MKVRLINRFNSFEMEDGTIVGKLGVIEIPDAEAYVFLSSYPFVQVPEVPVAASGADVEAVTAEVAPGDTERADTVAKLKKTLSGREAAPEEAEETLPESESDAG